MVVVETIAKIRRDYFVQGNSIGEIVRTRGVSRNTVRKVLRSGETAFRYERARQPMPRLGPFVERLEEWLEANEAKSRRERLTLVRLFEQLREAGYEGGYDAVRRHARRCGGAPRRSSKKSTGSRKPLNCCSRTATGPPWGVFTGSWRRL